VLKTDKISKEKRSWNMSRIGSKNTKPELWLRSQLHKEGLRYSLHSKNLPGKPDIVLKKYKTVIFVHGCFWHYHGCKDSKIPSSRTDWWKKKLERNKEHDKEIIKELIELGWRVVVIWECSIRKSKNSPEKFINKIKKCLLENYNYAESEDLYIKGLNITIGEKCLETWREY